MSTSKVNDEDSISSSLRFFRLLEGFLGLSGIEEAKKTREYYEILLNFTLDIRLKRLYDLDKFKEDLKAYVLLDANYDIPKNVHQLIDSYITPYNTSFSYLQLDISIFKDDSRKKELLDMLFESRFYSTDFVESKIREIFSSGVKKYFLDEAKYFFDTWENKDSMAEFNDQNPLIALNQIMKKIDCNGYLFENSFPCSRSEILKKSFTPKDVRSPNISEYQVFNYQPTLIKEKTKIGLDSLSSGEKILLGLGVFVYDRKINNQGNYVLLLDEIDTNLHPSMMYKFFDIVKNIFIKEYGYKSYNCHSFPNNHCSLTRRGFHFCNA